MNLAGCGKIENNSENNEPLLIYFFVAGKNVELSFTGKHISIDGGLFKFAPYIRGHRIGVICKNAAFV
jgi:hypothetical protein